jgi:hypothetical protein
MLIVTVPVRRSNRYPGVDVRQKTDLAADQVAWKSGLPVTTPTRTIIDLAAHLEVGRLARLVDWTVGQGLTSHESLIGLFAEVGRRGKPGTQKLRKVMEDRGGAADHDPSELEWRLVDLIERAGLPLPTREFKAPWLAPTNGGRPRLR